MDIFKKIAKKELLKITSLNSVSVFLKIIIGFITSKVIALFIGPSGMALVGNFRNFSAAIEGVATLGFTNGIVKYIAEHEKDKEYLKRFISTIFVSIFFMITVLCIFIYVFASTLSHYIFGVNFQFVDILIIFGLVLPLYATSQIIISIINGLGAFKKVIYINIIGNLLGLIITVGLIYYYKTFGALLAVVLIPSVLFFVGVFFIQKEINLAQFISLKSFDFSLLKPMTEYSLMTLVSVVLGSIVYLNIRKIIIETLDIKQAGYWEALSRISNYYFLFLTTILTVYFLPKLSKSNSNKETKSVFLSYYKEIIPFFFIGLILVFVLKDIFIKLMFTKEFLPISKLLVWQLIGDFFKAMSLILGYQFFAKKLSKAFIITELISLTILWFSSSYFLKFFGIEGIVMAHAFTFFTYLFILIFCFRKIWFTS